MSLKRNPLFLASAAALAASPALAETAFDGPYVGAVAGIQLHNSRTAVTEGTTGFLGLPDSIAPESLRLDNNDGWRGGVVAGWNGSSGSLVYGIEADVTFGPNRANGSFAGAAIPDLAPDGLTTSASGSARTTQQACGRRRTACQHRLGARQRASPRASTSTRAHRCPDGNRPPQTLGWWG